VLLSGPFRKDSQRPTERVSSGSRIVGQGTKHGEQAGFETQLDSERELNWRETIA